MISWRKRDKRGEWYETLVEVKCAFCGGTVTAGKTDDGVPMLLHTAPACLTFIQLDVNDFLAANRHKLGITDPNRN